MNMRSRDSVIFPRSVVTRLLMRPTRLLALEVPAAGSSAFLALPLLCLDCSEEVDAILDELGWTVSSEVEGAPMLIAVLTRVWSDPSCEAAVIVLSLTLSATGVPGIPSGAGDFGLLSVSALTRTRKACSKTSSVIIASQRARVRVYHEILKRLSEHV